MSKAKALELLDESEVKPAPCYQAPLDSLKSIFSIDKAHLAWAGRTFLALFSAFLVGYYGLPLGNNPEISVYNGTDHAPMIPSYDGGVAFAVIVFMTAAHGSTFSAALSRISAVVLSTISGQTLYYFFGWCGLDDVLSWTISHVGTIISTFLIVYIGIYIGFGGGENSAIGTRLAATSLGMLWQGCSDESSTYKTYSDYFHGLIEVVFGVALLTVVDMVFGDPPAANQAITAINGVMQEYLDLLTDYLDPDKEMALEDVITKCGQLKSDLSAAKDLSASAAIEPAFWRKPWQTGLFNSIFDAFAGFISDLTNLAEQSGKRQKECMKNFTKYDPVAKRILFLAKKTNAISQYTLTGKGKGILKNPIDNVADKKLLDDLSAEMNANLSSLNANSTEVHDVPVETRQCVITVSLAQMLNAHVSAQRSIVTAQKF